LNFLNSAFFSSGFAQLVVTVSEQEVSVGKANSEGEALL